MTRVDNVSEILESLGVNGGDYPNKLSSKTPISILSGISDMRGIMVVVSGTANVGISESLGLFGGTKL